METYAMNRANVLTLVALAATIYACGAGDPQQATGSAGLALAAPVGLQRAIQRDQDTPLVLAVMPKATCILHPEGFSEPTLNLFSDDAGRVRLYARARESAVAQTKLLLDCTGIDGNRAGYALELSVDPQAAVAQKGEDLALNVPIGKTRPPLSGDPLRFTQQELTSQGYPLRPDPVHAPEPYASWLQMVSRPATEIPPRLARTNLKA
jgi:hypothetical protein